MGATVEQAAQCLTFRLGEEIFALDISQVREVLDYTAVTRAPRAETLAETAPTDD